jgi:hypothetical protein
MFDKLSYKAWINLIYFNFNIKQKDVILIFLKKTNKSHFKWSSNLSLNSLRQLDHVGASLMHVNFKHGLIYRLVIKLAVIFMHEPYHYLRICVENFVLLK